MKKQALGIQFMDFYASKLKSENPERIVHISDKDTLQLLITPCGNKNEYPIKIEIHQVDCGDTEKFVNNFDDISSMIRVNHYIYNSESEISQRWMDLNDEELEWLSHEGFFEIAILVAEDEEELNHFTLPGGLNTLYEPIT